VNKTARKLAGSAASTARGHDRLKRCRELLERLDPDRPPAYVHAKEFGWQYRALRERVHLYSERLAAAGDSVKAPAEGMLKAEIAIELSLRYFQDVFTPQREIEELEDDEDSQDRA
jgi:hypothetical protein